MASKYEQIPHRDMVDNILSTYDDAPIQCLVDGQRWYAVAHDHARLLGHSYGVATDTVAMLIAVLSPQKNWEDNLIMAEQVLSGQAVPLATMNTYGKALGVLNGTVTEIKALKTRNFYELIRDSGNDISVCVDTHAIALAYGYRPGDAEKTAIFKNISGMYVKLQQAYIEAARLRRVAPYIMQATTWCARRSLVSKSASIIEAYQDDGRMMISMQDFINDSIR